VRAGLPLDPVLVHLPRAGRVMGRVLDFPGSYVPPKEAPKEAAEEPGRFYTHAEFNDAVIELVLGYLAAEGVFPDGVTDESYRHLASLVQPR